MRRKFLRTQLKHFVHFNQYCCWFLQHAINAGKTVITTNTPWDRDNKCQRWRQTKRRTLAAMTANAKQQLSLVKYEKCSQNATGEITSTFVLASGVHNRLLIHLHQLTVPVHRRQRANNCCTKQWHSSNTLLKSCSQKATQEQRTLMQIYTTKCNVQNIEQLLCTTWQKTMDLKATHCHSE